MGQFPVLVECLCAQKGFVHTSLALTEDDGGLVAGWCPSSRCVRAPCSHSLFYADRLACAGALRVPGFILIAHGSNGLVVYRPGDGCSACARVGTEMRPTWAQEIRHVFAMDRTPGTLFSAPWESGYKPRFVPWNPWECVLNRDGYVPRTQGNKQFFGLCAFTRSWEGLKLCQNVARVSPGGVKGLDLGLGMFTYLVQCMVIVASSPR